MLICPIIIDPLKWTEIWRPITNKSVYNIKEDCYYISSFGRIYSKISNRLLSSIETYNGYFRVYLYDNLGKGLYHLIHRILMIEFCYIPGFEEFQVNHLNGNKSQNYIWNLAWCTPSENIIHTYKTGLKTCKHGEDCSFSVITNEQARMVAQLITENKYSQKEIASVTNVPIYIVSNIATGSTWKWLYEEYNLGQYKREKRDGFSDEELHMLCQYFQNNSHLYPIKTDLYRAALKELFNIDYNVSMSASMSRIYNHKTRKDITDKYNF